MSRGFSNQRHVAMVVCMACTKAIGSLAIPLGQTALPRRIPARLFCPPLHYKLLAE